jgi:hypothetical protein
MSVTHRYPAVEHCIYCGSRSKLGDEHIIPFALNGGLLLPKASCDTCANVTHRFERTVARTMLGHFRIRHKVQSRRPEKRPTHVTVGTLMHDGTRGTVQVPVDEHPTMIFPYKFDQPTLLRGLPPDVEDFRWVPVSVFSKAELDAFIVKYHWDRQTAVKMVPEEFARMIAKIGYSFAVAEFGARSFRPLPQILDIILGRTKNVGYAVGGDWDIPPPDPKGIHVLTPSVLIKPAGAWIVIEIRLFPAFETPQHRAVVGELDFANREHFVVFQEKMKTATIREGV